jgi:hypothetical protein
MGHDVKATTTITAVNSIRTRCDFFIFPSGSQPGQRGCFEPLMMDKIGMAKMPGVSIVW